MSQSNWNYPFYYSDFKIIKCVLKLLLFQNRLFISGYHNAILFVTHKLYQTLNKMGAPTTPKKINKPGEYTLVYQQNFNFNQSEACIQL